MADVYPSGAQPLVLGDLRAYNGVDVSVAVGGLALIRAGLGSITVGQPQAALTVEAAGTRALRVGGMRQVSGSVAVYAGDSQPVVVGDLSVGVVVTAGGCNPCTVGGVGTAVTVGAAGSAPIAVGGCGALLLVSLGGLRFGSTGMHAVALADLVVSAPGSSVLSVGAASAARLYARARQSSPLTIGLLRIDRGAPC